MPILVTCKFKEDPIKNEDAIVFITFFQHSRATNSKVTGWIWPEYELIQDITPVLVTCKCDEDPIKNEGIIMFTTFLHYKSV